MIPAHPFAEVSQRAVGLRMLLLDVDGVLTDGGIVLIGENEEAKRFDVQDGVGVSLARAAGLTVGIVTARSSAVVRRRAQELKVDELFQGVGRKTEVLEYLVKKYAIAPSQVAYIGDDLQDLSVMEQVGVPIAVQNAVKAIKDRGVYVTTAGGGHGAVREAVEWLLDLRGDRQEAYRKVAG